MLDIIAIIALLIILLVIAILLLNGKGGFLIAGFNMLPKEKKDKVDWVNLCKFMGKIVLCVFCSCVFILASTITEIQILNTVGLIILALSVIIALVWSSIHFMAPTRK